LGGGGLIAFASNQSGDFDIYTIRPDGSGQQELTDSRLEDQSPAWAPDGSWIAFTSGTITGRKDLWLMRPDGSQLHELVQGSVYGPAWDPDSQSIVMRIDVSVSRTGSNNPAGLYISQVDGTGQRFLWRTPAGSRWWDPAWSPAGDVLAAVPSRVPGAAPDELHLIEPETLSMTPLTNTDGQNRGPDWSPQGDRVAFTSVRLDGNFDIYVINRDGTGEQRLTEDGAFDWQPSWSPDGRWIVFASNRTGNFDLYLLDLATLEVARLTDSLGDDMEPDWGAVESSEPDG
jgi:TolB protein